MQTYVVIPTYREAGNVRKLIEAINTSSQDSIGIIIVDDIDSIKTMGHTRGACSSYSNVTVLERLGKLGFGSAVCEGIHKALSDPECQKIITMDADFSHDPNDIPRLTMNGAHLTIGSRYIPGGGIIGWSKQRRILSWGANLLCRTLLTTGVHDNTTNFRCYSRECAEACLSASGQDFEWVITALITVRRKGFQAQEIPVTFVNRTTGKSTLKFRHVIKWLRFIMRETRL